MKIPPAFIPSEEFGVITSAVLMISKSRTEALLIINVVTPSSTKQHTTHTQNTQIHMHTSRIGRTNTRVRRTIEIWANTAYIMSQVLANANAYSHIIIVIQRMCKHILHMFIHSPFRTNEQTHSN